MKAQVILFFFGIIIFFSCTTNKATENKKNGVENEDSKICTLIPIRIEKESEPYYSETYVEDNGKTTHIICNYFLVEFMDKTIEDKINSDIIEYVKGGLFVPEDITAKNDIESIINKMIEDKEPFYVGVFADSCVINNQYIVEFYCFSSVQSWMGESPMQGSGYLTYDLTNGNSISLWTEIDSNYEKVVCELIKANLRDKTDYFLDMDCDFYKSDPSGFEENGVRFIFNDIKDQYGLPVDIFIHKDNIKQYLNKESIILKMWNDKSLQ